MGNHFTSLASSFSKKKRNGPLPIETSFSLPSPLPSWPSVSGGGFANGTVDLGGLEVCQLSTFTQVWAARDGGADGLGATFFKPSPVPSGFYILGYYAQPNNQSLFGWVLVGRDSSSGGAALAEPVDYTLIWNSISSGIKQDSPGYFWLPTPPDGYEAVGVVVTGSSAKPPLGEVRCVRADLTEQSQSETTIWSTGDFSVNGLQPATRGVQALGVRVGTFMAQANGSPSSSSFACLKNKDFNLSFMPNLDQINAIIGAYSPWIYFHPDEEFLPSSLTWFFDNGALIYQRGSSNPTPIHSDGSNLPQGGSNDGQYWIDLPADDAGKEKVKNGDLASTKVYFHFKPMLGGTFTDVQAWIFYPFNGPARAKVAWFNIKLGKIGEHVGDWEHVTLRISNFSGELWRVYFSEHGGGAWADASQLEFQGGNKPVTYSSLHGHAMYSKPGLVLQGDTKLRIGIRNDTAKGGSSVDSGGGGSFEVVAAEYLKAAAEEEPAWLNYEREWGPAITYSVEEELKKVEKVLPKPLRSELEKVVKSLPKEMLGEVGPTGPKVKNNWTFDEN